MNLAVGQLVTVMDPQYGSRPGRVVVADDSGVYIEGPSVDGSRVWSWSIDTDKLEQYVRTD